MNRLVAGLIAALSLVGSASAEELRPSQAKSIEMGDVTGVAYYTVTDDGFRVVATLASGEAAPVRFITTLASGQSAVLSVPQGTNNVAREVEIRRVDDAIAISDVSALTQPARAGDLSN